MHQKEERRRAISSRLKGGETVKNVDQLPLEMNISMRKINFIMKFSKTNSLSLLAISKTDNGLKEIATKFKIVNPNLHL